MNYQIGDLIYNEKFGEYAIYLGTTQWVGWISVLLVSTGERSQVHDNIWEIM